MNGRFLQVIAVGAGSWSASTTTIAETLQTLPALRAAVAGRSARRRGLRAAVAG